MSDQHDHFEPGRTPEEVTARTGRLYEHTDVRSRPPILFMAGVLVMLGLITVVIGVFGYGLYVYRQKTTRPPSELAVQNPVPPEPRLQMSPRADMDQMLAEERALLTGYGWIDRPAGVVRIPVERAMDLLAQRGLPPKRHDIPTTAGAAATTATLTPRPAGR